MGKRKGGGLGSKIKHTSGGMRRANRAKRLLVRVKMKIARWRRYKEENKATSKKSVRKGWGTVKLEKHASLLESIISKGRKVRD